ncbi:MAG: glycerol-3-phosphate dehydrogenase/oxidase [Desulfobacterales bacterium]|nr:glycerol-3-phosphate dehydrogenase/oxidase [Desulfobacterales bacterium]
MDNLQWNAKKRQEYINQAQATEFDLIIIGGGITGAGVAREAALRNLSFCMIDKNDFAFGTSSRSSKLAHGGLRYLSNKEFKLVRESTTERNWLRTHLPNLVRPLGFMFCSYEKGKDKPKHIRFALMMYDLLSDIGSNFKNYRKAKFFSPEFVEEFEPAVTRNDSEIGKMTFSGFYYDTNVDDSRLTLETIKESLIYSKGNSLAINYSKINDYIRNDKGKVCGVVASDELNGIKFDVKAKVVVVCTGIWTDELLKLTDFGKEKIYPTKGVHVVVPNERIGNRNAFGVRSFDDGRFFFILKRGNVSVIGTTDTDYFKESKNLDEPWCTKEDCDYLFNTVNRLFPHAELTYKDIIGTYAGIRPLIKQDGAKNESDVSREHEIFESKDGVISIAGGKLTTYRLMAEELIFHLVKKGFIPKFSNLKHRTNGFSKIPFIVGMTRESFDAVLKKGGLNDCSWPEQKEYLHQQYGKQAIDILKKIKSNSALGEPLLEGYPHCKAEIDFILAYENAPRLIDVLCRRTEAQWTIWHYKQAELAEKVAAIMADYYNWTDEKKKEEIEYYMDYVKKTIWF